MAELACWLTDSGRLNYKVVTHPAIYSLAQDRESSSAETSVLTTMLRRQLNQTEFPAFIRTNPVAHKITSNFHSKSISG